MERLIELLAAAGSGLVGDVSREPHLAKIDLYNQPIQYQRLVALSGICYLAISALTNAMSRNLHVRMADDRWPKQDQQPQATGARIAHLVNRSSLQLHTSIPAEQAARIIRQAVYCVLR